MRLNFKYINFLSNLDRLVKRVKNGLLSTKYKAVNYDQLKALAAKKRLEGKEALTKVCFYACTDSLIC